MAIDAAPAQACANATPLTVTVHPSVSAPGQATYTFSGSPAPDVTVNSDGTLDFHRSNNRILVTMQFDVAGWTWLQTSQINAMSYVLKAGHPKEFIPLTGRHEVKWIEIPNGQATFTFCYNNNGSNSRNSEYGIYMQYGGQIYFYDPIINNGGQPQL
jgi:hypothetical protein